jgi:hypothetical protein
VGEGFTEERGELFTAVKFLGPSLSSVFFSEVNCGSVAVLVAFVITNRYRKMVEG